jgi:hypothetical protein
LASFLSSLEHRQQQNKLIAELSSTTIYFILAKFVLKIVFAEGIAAIIIINLFGFSLLFFVLAIFSEYLGRIYDEVRDRPVVIQTLNGNDKLY